MRHELAGTDRCRPTGSVAETVGEYALIRIQQGVELVDKESRGYSWQAVRTHGNI